MKLHWQKTTDAIFGECQILVDDTGTELASARRHGTGRYIAHAHLGGRYLSHTARTLRSAIKHLNAELDRRSIGLFGVDDLEIVLS